MIIMYDIDSEINSYKEEIKKFKQELKNEKEKRFGFKCDQIALNQSREKEVRIKIEIFDLENKIIKLEAEKKRIEAEREAEREAEKKRIRAEREAEREAEKKRIEAEREAEKKRIEAEREAEREAEKKRIRAEREAEKKRIRAEREAERKRKDLLYKKLCVELTDDNLKTIVQILKEKNLFFLFYNKQLPSNLSGITLINDRHDFIKNLVNEFSEQEIWDLLKWEELFELEIGSFLDEFDEKDILLFRRCDNLTSKDVIIDFLKNNNENSKEKFELKIKQKKYDIKRSKRLERERIERKKREEREKIEREKREERERIEREKREEKERKSKEEVISKLINMDYDKFRHVCQVQGIENYASRSRYKVINEISSCTDINSLKSILINFEFNKLIDVFSHDDILLLKKIDDCGTDDPERILKYFLCEYDEEYVRQTIKNEKRKEIENKCKWKICPNCGTRVRHFVPKCYRCNYDYNKKSIIENEEKKVKKSFWKRLFKKFH